ncbi:MAG: CBS domain-containing protein [Candidatus Electrothrix sp. AR5]|nr:CBS domain-containing protein [Candidatus Electrothrix sp. AR5]
MINLQDIYIDRDTSVIDAIKVLDRSALQILLVVDQNRHLLGTITDGDIRRGILHGIDLSTPVSETMNSNPVTINRNTGRDAALSLMRSKSIHCIPVVDELQRVVGLETESRLLWQGREESWVVLMAGGLGMRLRPLTASVPKPLLKVNGKPMLEHIIDRFIEQGFHRFFLAVNYKSEMIRKHFGNGTDRGIEIVYVEEDKPLGTGGALSLLPYKDMSDHIIVMNGDLLTTLNFRQLLDFHKRGNGVATMTVRDYSFRIPYGVVEVDGDQFVEIVEKPAHSYFVNAGIYVIGADQLQHIPKDEFFDLPDLFVQLKEQGKDLNVFPLREEWRDIGSHHEYELANKS